MKKSSILLASSLAPVLAVALATQSCSGGETANGGGGGTSASGTGGRVVIGTGGGNFLGTGGSSSSGTGGQSSFGSGGSSVASGGSTVGAGGTGAGGSPVASGALTVTGSFVSNGTWMGYGFSDKYGTVTTTIMPSCTSPCPPTNTQWCASGNVGAEPLNAGASGAFLGFNIGQAVSTTATGTQVTNIVPTGTGISVKLSAAIPGGRIVIADINMNQWCYQMNPSGSPLPTTNMIPWSMFNTMCYNPIMGIGYTKQPISKVQILVPSGPMASAFNFCLLDVREY
jgi:hypothetical protein